MALARLKLPGMVPCRSMSAPVGWAAVARKPPPVPPQLAAGTAAPTPTPLALMPVGRITVPAGPSGCQPAALAPVPIQPW